MMITYTFDFRALVHEDDILETTQAFYETHGQRLTRHKTREDEMTEVKGHFTIDLEGRDPEDLYDRAYSEAKDALESFGLEEVEVECVEEERGA